MSPSEPATNKLSMVLKSCIGTPTLWKGAPIWLRLMASTSKKSSWFHVSIQPACYYTCLICSRITFNHLISLTLVYSHLPTIPVISFAWTMNGQFEFQTWFPTFSFHTPQVCSTSTCLKDSKPYLKRGVFWTEERHRAAERSELNHRFSIGQMCALHKFLNLSEPQSPHLYNGEGHWGGKKIAMYRTLRATRSS